MRAAGVVSRERRDENETRKHAVDFFGLERRVRGSTDLSAAEQDRLGSTQPYRMRLIGVLFFLSKTRGRVAEDRGSASRRDESGVSARGRAPMPSCESRAGRAESEARSVAR